MLNGGRLEIEISPEAVITSKVKGVTGAKCTEVDEFMKELGDVQTKLTEEYYNKEKPGDVLLSGLK